MRLILLLCFAALPLCCFAADSATPKPQPVTPAQAIEALNKAPPGSKLTFTAGGSLRETENATSKGATAATDGDKLSEQIDFSAPGVNLSEGRGATGGTAKGKQNAFAFVPPAGLISNPLLWVGLALLVGAGVTFYLQLRRAATVLGVAGVGLIAAAFYPWLLLFAVAAVLVVLAGPYVVAEIQAAKLAKANDAHREAVRAVVEGVDSDAKKPDGTPLVPDEAKKAVKAAIAMAADARDKAVIDSIKLADKVGKFA